MCPNPSVPNHTPHIKNQFASTFRTLRKLRRLSQEQFDGVSGRTYISALERSLKTPTIGKIEDLASVLEIHPATLVALSYCGVWDAQSLNDLLQQIAQEGHAILSAQANEPDLE